MPPTTHRGARVAHIGIAVRAIDEMLPFYRDLLGLDDHPLEDSDGAHIAGLSAGTQLIELLEPDSSDSPISKFLERRGPGIHHICFAVQNLDDILARCRDQGIRLIDDTPRVGAEGKRIAFLHPASTGGVLIELTED